MVVGYSGEGVTSGRALDSRFDAKLTHLPMRLPKLDFLEKALKPFQSIRGAVSVHVHVQPACAVRSSKDLRAALMTDSVMTTRR
jgi:hypothetical protein